MPLTLTDEQLVAALQYLDWQGGTMHEVLAQIATEYVHPPIPDRSNDWRAHFHSREEGPTGFGPTQEAAVIDLLNAVEAF